jgi:RNA-directed DNA polymerase
VILVAGTRSQTEALLPEVATVLSTVGLRLSVEKTLITHIDEGLDFLGWRIQRHQKRGTNRQPAVGGSAAPAQLGAARLDRLLPSRGVRPGVPIPTHDRLASGIRVAAAQTSEYRLEEPAPPLLRRHMVATGRRGRVVQPRFGSHHALPAQGIDHPVALATGKLTTTNNPTGLVESRMRGQLARPVREGGMKKRAGSNPETALHVDPTTTCT